MGLVLACVVRTLHDDWSFRLGENRSDESSPTFGGYAALARLLNAAIITILNFQSVDWLLPKAHLQALPHQLAAQKLSHYFEVGLKTVVFKIQLVILAMETSSIRISRYDTEVKKFPCRRNKRMQVYYEHGN